jgi:hypothetical protein
VRTRNIYEATVQSGAPWDDTDELDVHTFYHTTWRGAVRAVRACLDNQVSFHQKDWNHEFNLWGLSECEDDGQWWVTIAKVKLVEDTADLVALSPALMAACQESLKVLETEAFDGQARTIVANLLHTALNGGWEFAEADA